MTSSHQRKKPLQLLLTNFQFLFGATVIGIVVFLSVFANELTPYTLEDGSFLNRLKSPSDEFPLGADLFGRDVWTSMLYGARTSLYVGGLTVVLSLSLGISIGLISGYYMGWVDQILMRVVDIFMAFPGILLALSITSLMGPSVNTIVFSIAATGWTSSARLIRGQVLSIRERDYVQASKALGASSVRLMIKHILPQTLSPVFIHATYSLSGVIIVEAGLSFLGLGAQDGATTWGGLLAQGNKIELTEAPHLTLVPGAAIFLLVIALNFVGDSLRDSFDPKEQER